MFFLYSLIRPGPGRMASLGAFRRAFTPSSQPSSSSFHLRSFFSSPLTSRLIARKTPPLSHTPYSTLLRFSRRAFTRKDTLSAPRLNSTIKPGAKRFPERLLIYHAGTGRTTFLACLKVTTLFGLAFFTCLVAPAYVAASKPLWQIVGVAICGIVPFLVVLYTSSPFVVFIHLRLPAYARHPDRELLRRFVRNIPANTQLDITTMNLVGRPRLATVSVADLVPAREKLRIVNFIDTQASTTAAATAANPTVTRPTTANPAANSATPQKRAKLFTTSDKFPFIQLPPATRFGAPAAGNSKGVPYSWAWDDLLALIERRAHQPQSELGDKVKGKTGGQ